jgi:predicted GIY-YIG superfamily endonuclease
MSGTVYLIHFARPIGNTNNMHAYAQHYIGWTPRALAARLAMHEAGSGARIMAAVAAAGIAWEVSRTWPGGRDLERKIKAAKSAPRLCRICAPANRRRETRP